LTVYTVTLTVPKNTPKEKPIEAAVSLEKAVVTRLFIQIPAGHHLLTGLRILYGDLQLWPRWSGTWFRGDNIVLDFEEFFELPDDPTTLRIQAYNEDDTFSHSFVVHISTLPKRIAGWMVALARFVGLLRRLIGA